MRGRERFEYWRELVLVLLMLGVLVVDMTMFETMRSDGESGDRTITVVGTR
ncbi:hypothetical protein ACR42D_03625 [Desulfovibrio caledoniensis]|jgi:hypothetical protein